jgi:hypothetical protein
MDAGLTSSLIGGAIGTVLIGLAWMTARLSAIPGDIERHDDICRFVNEDLELWVADDHRRLRQELARIEDSMNKDGLLFSGAHGVARAEAKTGALHRYRDRLHECERRLADLKSHESWAHGLWRRRTKAPPIALAAAERVAPVLDEWRADVIQHGSGPSDRIVVHDPTRWQLSDLLVEIKKQPLERAKYST